VADSQPLAVQSSSNDSTLQSKKYYQNTPKRLNIASRHSQRLPSKHGAPWPSEFRSILVLYGKEPEATLQEQSRSFSLGLNALHDRGRVDLDPSVF